MGLDDFSGIAGYEVTADVKGLDGVVTTVEKGLDAILDLRRVVRQYLAEAQSQAVRNVSGIEVQYSGGTFTINRQTGKLVRSIQIYDSGPLSGYVVAGANYASALENGSPARDMKPSLLGKIIPFPVTGTTKEKKQAVADGNATAIQKYGSTGRKTRVEYIAFRKVGPNSKGFIIPAQPPRPFMQATAEVIGPKFSRAVADAFAKFITDNP
jgi:hypothetical protein